ncbi:NAD(P)H-dependent flavin oxidoreductase [Variovorax sp. N23]|uniref:NAD(P)H-dependent flavin oxidoreductase n=1 Tax=Variovorax sp. N23 TaxID=2980555 RepID=UPI0021C66606|nr:nitronate monooxygenase [Variovorax sp. N23]MCU4119121.1 nitronate monooxygenase [Variovorax sp. N23]
MTSRLPFLDRLAVPVIAAPMLRVSGIELVSAACRAGVVGAFPTANAESLETFDAWMQRLVEEADAGRADGRPHAPWCPNLIMRRDPARVRAEVELIVRHRAEVVITSVGSPAAVIPALHDGGCIVLADVASMHHARRAIEAGADGLVLLTAGAGGHTGWANPLAFVREVRGFFDGPLVLAGGLSDGVALRAATVLGCDLGSMGTRFIASAESLASEPYKQMLATSSLDDVMTTRAFTGLPANFLRPAVIRCGLDPDALDEGVSVQEARRRFGGGSEGATIQRWADLWSAGHSVSGVAGTRTVAEIVGEIEAEFSLSAKATNLICRQSQPFGCSLK